MPPRKRPSAAPAGRVYKSAQPLAQLKFPERRKNVRGYGSVGGKKVPRLSLRKQETLTQMDFVRMGEMGLLDGDEIEDGDGDGELGEEAGGEKRGHARVAEVVDEEVEAVEKPRRMSKRRRTEGAAVKDEVLDGVGVVEQSEDVMPVPVAVRKPRISKECSKRRRTMGDIPSNNEEDEYFEGSKRAKNVKQANNKRRKTVGDKPSNSSSPQYHTQTITQLDWGTIFAREEEYRQDEGNKVEKSFDSAVFDVPNSSQLLAPARKSSRVANREKVSKAHSPELEKSMRPPQTPKRVIQREIPSSESPATPAFLRSGASQTRTPLNEKSTNTPIPFDPNPSRKPSTSPYKLPKLVIQDTFDSATDVSQMARIPSTPSKKSSPPKSVRFAIPDEPQTVSPRQEPAVKRFLFSKSEILDSDAESDDDFLDEDVEENAGPQPETCYGEFGEETQLEADHLVSTATSSRLEESPLNESSPRPQSQHFLLGSPTLTQPAFTSQKSEPDQEETNAERDEEEIIEEEEDHHSHYEEKTQFRESQRLHTQHLTTFAPRTLISDIFVSLPSQHLTDILARVRTHDIRAFAYPTGASRLWIYVLRPIYRLTYMAVIGSANRPGDLSDEKEKGLGNKAFNARKMDSNWHAYEIEELYELADPLTLEQLVENEWLEEAPKRFERVRPAVIDGLIANLMPPIFSRYDIEEVKRDEEESQEQHDEQEIHPETQQPSSSINDTQEATAQLLSTIQQYTQHDSFFTQLQPVQPSPANTPGDAEEIIPSSQDETMLPPPPLSKSAGGHFNTQTQAGLSQATTVDLTQTQLHFSATTPRRNHSHHSYTTHSTPQRDEMIVWESPTRPVHSSTPAAPYTLSRELDNSAERENVGNDERESVPESSIVVPFSIASSQMLTRSQMEREVMFDSIPQPPAMDMGCVGDSDEDEDEGDEL